jgi:lysozyme
METSENGISLIKGFEGFSSKPYPDVAGFLTIGYGHKINPGELFAEITEDQGEALLRTDLRSTEVAVNELVSVSLTQNQFDALVSFTFNLGRGRLAESTLLKLLNSGNYDGAAGQFERWAFVGLTKNAALVRRRQAEQTLFLQS